MRASEWSWPGAPIWFWGDRSVEFNLTSATNFWCSFDRPKNTLKVTKKLATLPYTASELKVLASVQPGGLSFRFHSVSVWSTCPCFYKATNAYRVGGGNASFPAGLSVLIWSEVLQPNAALLTEFETCGRGGKHIAVSNLKVSSTHFGVKIQGRPSSSVLNRKTRLNRHN